MTEFIPYGMHSIDEKDINEVVNVLKSGWITGGSKVKDFETKVSKYVGNKYSVAVSNGTAALELAVQALNLPKGSEVITTPFTFIATSNSVIYNGLTPVFVDIKKNTFNIDPEEVKKKINDKTKAIICVDFAGQPCDMEELRKIADENDLYLIEDAAHSIGAEYKGKKVGGLADITTFSFHPVKHITTGEGGMILTNDEEFYKRLLLFRNHGIDKDSKERFSPNSNWSYDMKLLGRNYRITDFQCALGSSQLDKLDSFIEKRNNIANKYLSELKEVVNFPIIKKDIKHAWHIFTILVDNRDDVFNFLRKKNIGVNVHYIPCYNHTYYKDNFNFNPEDFPNTEDVFSKILTIPLYPTMSDEQVKYVIENIKEAVEHAK